MVPLQFSFLLPRGARPETGALAKRAYGAAEGHPQPGALAKRAYGAAEGHPQPGALAKRAYGENKKEHSFGCDNGHHTG